MTRPESGPSNVAVTGMLLRRLPRVHNLTLSNLRYQPLAFGPLPQSSAVVVYYLLQLAPHTPDAC